MVAWVRGLYPRSPYRERVVAPMERDRLIEPTKAGLARTRAQGRVGGRPRKHSHWSRRL